MANKKLVLISPSECQGKTVAVTHIFEQDGVITVFTDMTYTYVQIDRNCDDVDIWKEIDSDELFVLSDKLVECGLFSEQEVTRAIEILRCKEISEIRESALENIASCCAEFGWSFTPPKELEILYNRYLNEALERYCAE